MAYARRAIEADPLREEGDQELIRIYAAQGQGAKALREYRELERRLEKALGLAPGEDARDTGE